MGKRKSFSIEERKAIVAALSQGDFPPEAIEGSESIFDTAGDAEFFVDSIRYIKENHGEGFIELNEEVSERLRWPKFVEILNKVTTRLHLGNFMSDNAGGVVDERSKKTSLLRQLGALIKGDYDTMVFYRQLLGLNTETADVFRGLRILPSEGEFNKDLVVAKYVEDGGRAIDTSVSIDGKNLLEYAAEKGCYKTLNLLMEIDRDAPNVTIEDALRVFGRDPDAPEAER